MIHLSINFSDPLFPYFLKSKLKKNNLYFIIRSFIASVTVLFSPANLVKYFY